MKLRYSAAAAAVALLVAGHVGAAEPVSKSNAGKQVFRQQCALCHSAEPGDGGGAQ